MGYANRSSERLSITNLQGITYQAEVLDWNGFKAVQRAFISCVPDIELPTDIAIMAAHRTAAKHGIRTILSGGNIVNEGILPSLDVQSPRQSLFRGDCETLRFASMFSLLSSLISQELLAHFFHVFAPYILISFGTTKNQPPATHPNHRVAELWRKTL